jgi:nicotinate-nucleotide pyrophosphorylase
VADRIAGALSGLNQPAKFRHGDRLIEAARHVSDGKRIVARQQALVTRLKACGSSTLVAEQTLQTFLRSLAIFEDDLRQLQTRGGEKAAATSMAHEGPSGY